MATGRTGEVLQHLRRAVLLRDGAGPSRLPDRYPAVLLLCDLEGPR